MLCKVNNQADYYDNLVENGVFTYLRSQDAGALVWSEELKQLVIADKM